MLLIMMVGTLSEKDRDKDKPNIHCLSSLSIIGPTQVMVNLYVRSFEKIDDVKMEFSVQITFRKCFSLDNLKLKSDSRNQAKFDINGFQLPVVARDSNLKIKMKRRPNI